MEQRLSELRTDYSLCLVSCTAMEDAHATILDLDNPDESAQAQCGPGKKGKNSFFAVYDGHGGQFALLAEGLFGRTLVLRSGVYSGSTIARFSGDTVHKRLRALPEYQERKWEQSMRRAFLKTDEDLRSSVFPSSCILLPIIC